MTISASSRQPVDTMTKKNVNDGLHQTLTAADRFHRHICNHHPPFSSSSSSDCLSGCDGTARNTGHSSSPTHAATELLEFTYFGLPSCRYSASQFILCRKQCRQFADQVPTHSEIAQGLIHQKWRWWTIHLDQFAYGIYGLVQCEHHQADRHANSRLGHTPVIHKPKIQLRVCTDAHVPV